MSNHHFDLMIVIGSGPPPRGLLRPYFNKRVALIEKEVEFGGAAANTGTLPSKALRETAVQLSGFRARGLYGVDLSLRRNATVRDFLVRERQVRKPSVTASRRIRSATISKRFKGWARSSTRTLSVCATAMAPKPI